MKTIQIILTLFIFSLTNNVFAEKLGEEASVQPEKGMNILELIMGNQIISGILFAIFTIFMTIVISGLVKSKLETVLNDNSNGITSREEVNSIIIKTVNIFIWVFGVSAAAGFIGLDLGIFMGGIGIGVGFALQSILTNFVAGMIIIFQGNYSVGNVIDVAGKIGTIKNMNSLFTEIEQFDGLRFFVPNGKFLGEVVTNINANTKRRTDILIGLDYDSDIVKAKEIMYKVVENFPTILKDPGTNIIITDFDDSSIGLKLMYWIDTKENLFGIRSNVMETINLAFKQAGIVIPYPQVTLGNREGFKLEK